MLRSSPSEEAISRAWWTQMLVDWSKPEALVMTFALLSRLTAAGSSDMLLAAANMTVGLFTSMRLPPMLAEQESYVEEFLEWEKMRVSPTFSLPCILPLR